VEISVITENSEIYLAIWIAACALASTLCWKNRKTFALFRPAYWRSLCALWKVVTFLIATSLLTAIAPYANDPTWDCADSIFMSVLTFATAPWAIGVFYRASKGWATRAEAYTAFCACLFSISWSYDLYLLIRDGSYPITWLANIPASLALYLPAGLFWSLEWSPEKGDYFAFSAPEWPVAGASPFRRVLLPASAFMIVAALTILYWGVLSGSL
jgi:hypothetical protein